jgi:hypothetical protein
VPEGINSVADLRVIVDANADKFHSGVQGIMRSLGELEADGSKKLTGLDTLMAAVGDVAAGVGSKINLATGVMRTAVNVFDQLAKQGRSAAEALGATAEYDALTSSLGGLGLTMKDTAATGFAVLASSAYDGGLALLGVKADTESTSETTEDFARRVLVAAKEAVDDYTMALKQWSGNIKEVPGELDKAAESAERNAKRFREAAEQYENWGFGSLAPKGWISERLRGIADWFQEEGAKADAKLNDGLSEGRWAPKTIIAGKEIVELLGRESAALQRRTEVMRMSAAEAAEYNYIQDKIAEGLRKGTLTDAAVQAIEREGARIRANTQALEDYTKAKQEAAREEQRINAAAQQRDRAETQLFANTERELTALRLKAQTVGMTVTQTAELVFYETKLQQLRALGGPETPDQVEQLRKQAAEYGRLTEAVSAQQTGLRRLGEIGQTVSGTLASAFAQWTRGAELDVKNMVASMLNELAQLTFRRGALEPLFGGGMGGQGSDGGLFSSLLGSIFGGFRESGGDVEAGKAYVVGEKRAELFIPGQNGTIAPSVGGGRGGEIHVYVHGTEDFDARVESTAEGVVARQAPSIVQAAVASSSKLGSRTLPGQLQNHQRRGTQ